MSRRRWMSALASTAAALPLLPSLEANGGDLDPPKRFVVLWQPNGTTVNEYVPQGSPDAFTLGRYLQPIDRDVVDASGSTIALRDHMTVFTGHEIAATGPASLTDAHAERASCALTGRPMTEATGFDGPGMSIDQHVAAALGDQTPVRSLQLSPVVAGAGQYRGISFEGANLPLPFRNDPQGVFDDYFAGEADPAADEVARRRRRKGALDQALREIDTLRPKLGAHDQDKLERHATALQGLVALLDFQCGAPDITVGEPEDCSSTTKPGCQGYRVNGERMRNIMVSALACRMTHVVTYSFGEAGAHYAWPWHYGTIAGDNHSAGHLILGEADQGAEKHMAAQEYQAQWVAEFLTLLAATPEGSGTMLDHTVVLWQNELGQHDAGHDPNNAGLVAFGGDGVGLPPVPGGRWLDIEGRRQNDVHATLATLAGVPTESFGDPSWFQGRIEALL
ncbi:MAG: DUF1552 domain-containing protein [Myxococcota bacterium]